jgi:hypothetical protein
MVLVGYTVNGARILGTGLKMDAFPSQSSRGSGLALFSAPSVFAGVASGSGFGSGFGFGFGLGLGVGAGF